MSGQSENPREVIIDVFIKTPDDLFVIRSINPLHQDQLYRSGMDHIMNELKAIPPRKDILIKIHLQEDSAMENGVIMKAIASYCQYQITLNQREKQLVYREGFSILQRGSLFLILCLLLIFGLRNQELLPELINFFLIEGLIIAGWVSMWRPIDIFLFEWLPYKNYIRWYNKILRSRIELLR